MRKQTIIMGSILAAAMVIPATAMARPGFATTEVHMRAGPSTNFPVITTVNGGARVHIHGCQQGYNWCDVSWHGDRGWIYGRYLQFTYHNRRVLVPRYGADINLPIVNFSVDTYWRRHYRHRGFYHRRHYWHERYRHHHHHGHHARYGHHAHHGRFENFGGHERHRPHGHHVNHEHHRHHGRYGRQEHHHANRPRHHHAAPHHGVIGGGRPAHHEHHGHHARRGHNEHHGHHAHHARHANHGQHGHHGHHARHDHHRHHANGGMSAHVGPGGAPVH